MGTYIFPVPSTRKQRNTEDKIQRQSRNCRILHSKIHSSFTRPTQDVPFTIKSHLGGDGIGV